MKAPVRFSLTWVFEPFSGDPTFESRRMFGGLAAYVGGRLVACLTESPGQRDYRGRDYGFDIWNGILWPTSHEHHESLRGEYPSLVGHPVLGKWLYLPMSAADFEDAALGLAGAVAEGDARLGVEPGARRGKRAKKTARKTIRKVKRK